MTAPGSMPLTVIGGFLGAGKTTLLNYLLKVQHSERVLVMVNDFGSINIDAELLDQGRHDRPGVVRLQNGCVCCSIGGDLMQAFLQVMSMPDRPDRIIVEASGVADPTRIAQIGRVSGGLSDEGVITLVDASAVRTLAADKYVGDIVRQQILSADIVLLNKLDLSSDAEIVETRAWLRDLAPRTRVVSCIHGEVDAVSVLGIGAGKVAPDAAGGPVDVPVPDLRRASTRHADTFHSSTLATAHRFDRRRIEYALDALPQTVLRGKGFVELEGEATPALLQLCGSRWTLDPVSTPAPPAGTHLVFIATGGRGVPRFDAPSHFEQALASRDAASVDTSN